MRARSAGSPADGLAALAFVAVPLAACPAFWDQFTTVKWYALSAIGASWFLVEAAAGLRWPSFLRGRATSWSAALAAALLVGGSLRSGVAWAMPVLAERLAFLLVALAAFGYFRRRGLGFAPLALAAAAAAAAVILLGLAQLLGWRPLPFLTAGDQRSASFGNVNLAAQFVGLAVLFALAAPASSRGLRLAREALLAGGLVYLWFLFSRSALLGLAAGLAALLFSRRLALLAVTRSAAAAALCIVLLGQLGPPGLRAPGPEKTAAKALSIRMRLDVWASTLHLVADHPLGVGTGNFGDAFIPYQLGLETVGDPAVLFRSPHNEVLRLVAEGGLPFATLTGFLLVALLRRVRVRRADVPPPARGLLAAAGAFLAVESCFQFPLATAFGALCAATLLGLALAAVESPPEDGSGGRLPAALVPVAGVLCLAGAACSACSELLFVNRRDDLRAQALACRLDARNLPACVTAAWLHGRTGQGGRGRQLLLQVLDRSPYYFPAIRLLGEEAEMRGDRPEACLALWTYDQLLRGRSPVHDRVGALCPTGPPDFSTQLEMPFYERFPIEPGSPSGPVG
jgi:O-antigen ligase